MLSATILIVREHLRHVGMLGSMMDGTGADAGVFMVESEGAVNGGIDKRSVALDTTKDEVF